MTVRLVASVGRRAMTLIEMLVVLVILVAVAALLIPRMSGVKAQADSASSASVSADVMNNIEAYRTLTGYYPRRFDSLLSGDALYTKLWAHPGPGGAGFAAQDVTGETYHRSIGHAFGSGLIVSDHDEAATDPSSSGTTDRTIATSSASSSNKWAVVTDTAVIQAAGYPSGTLPDGVTLVGMGVGDRCDAVGKTMAGAPRCTAVDADEYGRYIAIFALYADGRPASLQAVVDSQRQSVDARIVSFKAAAPVRE